MLHGYEQDAELKAARRAARSRWPGILFKIFCILGFIICAALIALSQIGGSSEPLRLSVEQFFRDSTGYEPRLYKLNSMEFFPATIVDFEDLRLYAPDNVQAPVITVEKVRIEAGFWDVMFTNGEIRFIDIETINLNEGIFIPNSILVEFLKAEDTAPGLGQLVSQGRVGPRDFRIATNLESSGEGFKKRYRLTDVKELKASLGNLDFTGLLSFNARSNAILKDLRIVQNNQDIVTGAVNVSFGDDPKIGCDLQVGSSQLKCDFIILEGKLTGIIKSDKFSPDDFSPSSGFNDFLNELETALGYKNLLEKSDINLEVPGYKGKLPLKSGRIDISALPASAK